MNSIAKMTKELPSGPIKVGLVGSGIQHSMSPVLHEEEARRIGLNYTYNLIDTDLAPYSEMELHDILSLCQHEDYSGLNITYPCKQRAFELMHERSPEAEALGAVNTVLFENGRMVGHNTDWYGFLASFKFGLPKADLSAVTVIGAGGAGSAICYALLSQDVSHLTIVDRDTEQCQRLLKRLLPYQKTSELLISEITPQAFEGVTGVVNCTPVGMLKLPGQPIPTNWLRPEMWVADIVYVPLETELIKSARKLGCKTLVGGGMTVHQAAMAFKLFSNVEPDPAAMAQSFNQHLKIA